MKTPDAPKDIIHTEIVASNHCFQLEKDEPDSVRFFEFSSANIYLQPSKNKWYQQVTGRLGTSHDNIREAFKLCPELLHRIFRLIDESYDFLDVFIERELGVGRDQHAPLRAQYTYSKRFIA